MLSELLKDAYDIELANCGESCLQKVEHTEPDLIILDITMEGMDGIETCRLLRQDPHLDAVPIVFASGNTDIQSQLDGFQQGADGYITKPIVADQLFQVIQTQIAKYDEYREISKNAINAKQVFNTAYADSKEMDRLRNIIHRALSAETLQEIGLMIREELALFGLNSCIQVRNHWGALNFGCDDESFEARLMHQAHAGHRILDVNNKTLVNHKYISILVLNMPTYDEARYGRYKDHLSFLAISLSHKVDILLYLHFQTLHQQADAKQFMDESRLMVASVANTSREIIQQEQSTLIQLIETMLNHMMLHDFDEDQQSGVLQILRENTDELQREYEEQLAVNDTLHEVVTRFTS